jgi:peptidoglycan/xylan/chitin deacetylase (PgdA/CDA1 family)
MVRSDTSQPIIYLIFTGHDYYEGFEHVMKVLNQKNIKASFFLTGDFVRNHSNLVLALKSKNHFIGAHSDKHLLYCDWKKRDSLLVSAPEIERDIRDNLQALALLGIEPKYFMPPYEWYNRQVVNIAENMGQKVVNFSHGTRSNADYTTPQMANYVSNETILNSIYDYEKLEGMNGFHLLIHPGTSPDREEKLWQHLEQLIIQLEKKAYRFNRF